MSKTASGEAALVTNEEFQKLNFCVRMADPVLAVETVVKNIVGTCKSHMEADGKKKWISMSTNSRRDELAQTARLAAAKLVAFAAMMDSEVKRTS